MIIPFVAAREYVGRILKIEVVHCDTVCRFWSCCVCLRTRGDLEPCKTYVLKRVKKEPTSLNLMRYSYKHSVEFCLTFVRFAKCRREIYLLSRRKVLTY